MSVKRHRGLTPVAMHVKSVGSGSPTLGSPANEITALGVVRVAQSLLDKSAFDVDLMGEPMPGG